MQTSWPWSQYVPVSLTIVSQWQLSGYLRHCSAYKLHQNQHRKPQPSIPPGSVNEYQLLLGRQSQVRFIPLADVCGVCRWEICEISWEHVPYLSALEVWSRHYTNPNLYLYLTQTPTWYVSLLQFQDFTFISWDLSLNIWPFYIFRAIHSEVMAHFVSSLAILTLTFLSQNWLPTRATLLLNVGFLQPFILEQVWTGRQMRYKA